MERGILRWVIENRRVTLFLALALVVLGLYSYWMVPKQENPQVSPPVANISVIYPGASPEEIEESVTRKIEDEIIGIPGFDYVQSYSQNSVATVILWLHNDTDVDKAWEELRLKMDDLQPKLPDRCKEIEVNTDLDATAGFILSFSGANYSYEQLASFAEEIKKEIAGVNGISRLEIIGKQEKQVKVEVDYGRLNQINLSLDDVVNILQAQNIQLPSGDINDGNIRIVVNTPGKFRSIEEISDLVIGVSANNGNVLRLKDIAEIGFETEETTSKIKYNGKNAVLLVGYLQENRNVIIIGTELEKKLAEAQKLLPGNVNIDEVLYQPNDIKKSVNNLMKNLLQGMLFVILVIYLGMGLHNALVVSTAIPLSILLSFSAMNLFGIYLHQISIAGLIISLGMLVDNAIVVSDSIQVRLDNKEERLYACIKGAKDVAIPVLTATLTTVAAYIPLLILPGTAGEYIRSIPQIVMISLTASYLVALLFTPTMAYLFFKEGRGSQKGSFVWASFKRLSLLAMDRKWLVIKLAAGTLLVTMLLASLLTLVFFPKADKNTIYLNIRSEQAANLDKTEELAQRAEEILREQKEVVQITTAVGEGLPKFFMTIPNVIKSSDTGQIMVSLDLKKGGRFKNNTQLLNYLQYVFDTSITGGVVTVKELEQAEPVEAPVIIRLTGDNRERLQQMAGEIKDILWEIEGTVNVDDDAGDKKYQYQIDIDTGLASQMGLTRYDIQKEINIALRGKVASQLRVNKGEEYDILVKSEIPSIEELENLAIKSGGSGNKVILKQAAQVRLVPQFPIIKRYNREGVVNVLADVSLGYSAVEIQNELQKKMTKLNTQGVKISFDGEKSKIKKHFGNLGTAALFALFAIYIIMLIQFNSLSQPLIILVSIPLSVIGSVIGLLFFRQPLSFTALLGVVSLIGIVVNNAIILIDYINWERKQGKNIDEACRHAVEKRIRPILLTTATTVLGLTPLIFGGTLFVPMAVSLMSGLLVSTLLTLVVIPVVYSLVEK